MTLEEEIARQASFLQMKARDFIEPVIEFFEGSLSKCKPLFFLVPLFLIFPWLLVSRRDIELIIQNELFSSLSNLISDSSIDKVRY